jgi:hypothetical protein
MNRHIHSHSLSKIYDTEKQLATSPHSPQALGRHDDDNRDGVEVQVTEATLQLAAEEDAHMGVKKVEAAQKVYVGGRGRWWLYLGWVPLLSFFSYVKIIVCVCVDWHSPHTYTR